MQHRAHGFCHAHLRQFQHAFDAGDGFQAAVIAAIAAFTIRVNLGVADLHQAAAAGVQQAAIGDHSRADVVVDYHLDDVARPREAPNNDSAMVQALISCCI